LAIFGFLRCGRIGTRAIYAHVVAKNTLKGRIFGTNPPDFKKKVVTLQP